MGLNIRDIIPRKEIEVSDLKEKTICVDAFNALYQFLSSIRQPDGTPLKDSKERVTSHLSGIFYRNISLLAEGIKLIYVFDGKAPELKQKTYVKRQEARDTASEKYEVAKKEEDVEGMRKYSQQLLRLDKDMIDESKELLEAMGILVIQAPSEGEAQAAHLARVNQDVYAAVSQDYDSLLFGAPKLVRNLTLSRRRKTYQGYIEVKPEIIELEMVLNRLEINLDQLICIGILVGTDYNPKGVPGIGQKKALDLVKKFRTPVRIFEEVKQRIHSLPREDWFDWQDIFEIFKKHAVENLTLDFPKINEEKIKKILVEEHDFSIERIEKQLDKIRALKKKLAQKDLDKWF